MANDPREDQPAGEPESPPAEAEQAAPAAPPAPAPAPSRWRRTRDRLVRFHAYMREHYGHMDPRTAGLFRIVVGFLCATDAMRHWWYARTFYSNDGVLTNHYHLFHPSSGHNFSLYHAFSSVEEVHVAFAFSVLCHLCLMVGWHARFFSVVSFILVTSLDNRLVMVENGGYVVVNLVAMYAMFLPTDRRFSVDAWRRSLRERKERTLAEVGARHRPAWATEDYVSLAVFLVVLNLAVVYFFNVVNKSGWIWRKGETVHYVLYINRMVTGIAVFFRKLIPMPVTRGLAWWTICHEALLVPLILLPFGRRVTRTLALLGIWSLHVVFGTMFRLGPFAWFMICWSLTLIGREQWAILESLARRRAVPVTVIVDRGSPLAFTLARVLARLDGLDLLAFAESSLDALHPPLLAARTEAGSTLTGVEALRALAGALPAGRYVYPLLRLATLGALPAVYTFAEAHREAVARFFALTVPARGAEDRPVQTPLSARLGRYRGWAREALLVYFGVCAVSQAVLENKSIPPAIRDNLKMPGFMFATIEYPRLFQGWGMFAPNPITDDGIVVVDGRTIDGRKIDPFTGRAPDLDLTDSEGEAIGQIPQDYFNRIRMDRNVPFRQGLEEYLRQWHLRTGRPQDELVAFDVYWLKDQCPRIGEDRPYGNELLALLSWRKPGYRPERGMEALPPQPKIVSAETKQPEKQERRLWGWKLPGFLQN